MKGGGYHGPPNGERDHVKAIVCKEFGPPEKLLLEEVDAPVAGEGQLVIEARASTVTSLGTTASGMLDDPRPLYLRGNSDSKTQHLSMHIISFCSEKVEKLAICGMLGGEVNVPALQHDHD